MSAKLVDAIVGICVHDPDVFIEPPSDAKNTAATALSRELRNASLSPNAKVAFMIAQGALGFEESQRQASKDLPEQMRLHMVKNGLEPSNYDLQFFSEELRSDLKILWVAAVQPLKKKRWKIWEK